MIEAEAVEVILQAQEVASMSTGTLRLRSQAAAFLAACATAVAPLLAHADAVSVLRRFEGYTVLGVMTITGWQDPNGKKGDSFEGCEYDRIIVFNDSKVLACAGYSYSYGYRPEAAILVRGGTFKMIVGDQVYDMRSTR
jgi:hypothetical protein